MSERIYIPQIQKELQYRDRRSAQKWCRNNNVRILSDIGSNRQFVLIKEFVIAINNCHFKGCGIGNSHEKYFTQYNNAGNANKYKPQGEYEKNFLTHLQNF
jgi:hypothetical protein